MTEHVFAIVITALGGIACGGAGYLVLVHLRRVVSGPNRVIAGAYASARIGFVIVVGLLSAIVADRGTADVHAWQSWVYFAGVALAGAGYTTLAVRAFIHRKEKT